jgi:putative hemolysin
MINEGVKNAELINRVLENPAKLLSAILIGNNIVNIAASAIATVIATDVFGNKGVGIATGVLTVLVLIFGEVTPKTFARNNSESVSLFVVKPIYLCMVVLTPCIWLLNLVCNAIMRLLGANTDQQEHKVTETEFRTMVDVSHEEGVLESDEKQMITNVVDFGDSDAKELMIPRIDMVAVPDSITLPEVLEVFRNERYTRLPVYSESLDHIIGILSFKDIMLTSAGEDFKVSDYMKEPYFTYESKPCSKLFSVMKREKISMAVVLDEYGGTAGIVTLQDLIEEIVGDIIDDSRADDDEDEIIKISDDDYIVAGGTKLDDVNEALGTAFEYEDMESIGGYVVGVLGSFPTKGDVVETERADFRILEIDKNRIERMRITLKDEQESDKED